MAPRAGLEPTTTRLEGGCSIQLSYRDAIRSMRYKRQMVSYNHNIFNERVVYGDYLQLTCG